MKVQFFIPTLWVGLLVAGSAIAANPVSVLTLDEAKRIAVAQNPEIAAIEKAREESKMARKRVTSAFLPRLGLGAGIDNELAQGGAGTSPLYFAYGQWNLFRGFQDSYQVKMADIEVDKRSLQYEKAKFRLGLDVEAQYYLYVFKTLAESLKNEAWDLNEKHKKLARIRKASGLLSESDLMEYDLRDSLLQSDIASLRQEEQQAKTALKTLMGSDPLHSDFKVEAKIGHWHVTEPLENLLTRAREENESVLVARKDLGIAEMESKQSNAKWWPEINLEAQAGKIPYADRYLSNETTFRGNILARWELFSGFDTMWQKRESELKRQKLEKQLKAAEVASISNTEIAWQRIKAIEARVHLEERNEVRAQKYYTTVINEYRRGVRNSTDVKVAAEALYDASLRRESFKYEFLNEKILLERTLSGPVLMENKPEGEKSLKKDHPAIEGVLKS